MKLTLSDSRSYNDPTDEEIPEAVSQLDVQRDGEGFAIVERDTMTYVQVSGDGRRGLDMEYQLGDRTQHYRADRNDLSLEEIMDALAAFRDGSIDWNQLSSWSRL